MVDGELPGFTLSPLTSVVFLILWTSLVTLLAASLVEEALTELLGASVDLDGNPLPSASLSSGAELLFSLPFYVFLLSVAASTIAGSVAGVDNSLVFSEYWSLPLSPLGSASFPFALSYLSF